MFCLIYKIGIFAVTKKQRVCITCQSLPLLWTWWSLGRRVKGEVIPDILIQALLPQGEGLLIEYIYKNNKQEI